MDVRGGLKRAVVSTAARCGYELRIHPGIRRAQLMRLHGVDLVLDVGGAQGEYVHELRRFGYHGKVISFEPLAYSYSRLVRASSKDERWTPVPLGLGATNGPGILHVSASPNSSSLLPMRQTTERIAPHISYVREEMIQIVRLDDFLAGSVDSQRSMFMKIDVQGYEGAVLDGAQRSLRSTVGVQVEMSFVRLYEGDLLYHEVIERLNSQGFELIDILRGFRHPSSGQLLQADGIFFRHVDQGEHSRSPENA